MKLLVVGDSISAGTGFELGKDDPSLWPNQVSRRLNADLTNLSVPGYDNTGIFLNTVSEITLNDYDLILVQFTALNRLIVSPNIHGYINISIQPNLPNYRWLVNDEDYKHFLKTLTLLNNDFEHWNRLVKIIYTLQNLSKKGYNIKIVNGLLNLTEDSFKNKYSQWAKDVINYNYLPDKDIEHGVELIYEQIKKIDLSIWISPYQSLHSQRVDTASTTDFHPGPKSHNIYTDLIFNNIITT